MQTVEEFAKNINKRLRFDKDLVIAVTGSEGSGKTTLGIALSIAGDKNFDTTRNVLYSPDSKEMHDKILGLSKYSWLLVDEAIKILYKQNWANKSQRFLNQLYALCRKENKVSILCIPRFIDLNEYFRNHRVKIWIHIISEISNENSNGKALIFAPSWSPFTKDPWWFSYNQKMIDDFAHQTKIKDVDFSLSDKLEVLENSRNFLDVLDFSWTDDITWGKYLEDKKKVEYITEDSELSNREIETKTLNKQKKHLLALADFLKEKGCTDTEICKRMNLSPSGLYKYRESVKKFEANN